MRTLSALLLLSVPLLAADLTATKSKDEVTFKDGDKVVTKYLTADTLPKPHFWPLNAPDGTLVTQSMPADHKHHRSVWFCHGDVIPDGLDLKTKSSDKRVKGVDFWSEHEGHGKIVCVEVGEPKAGKDGVSISTKNEWRSPDGVKILDEVRVLTVRKLEKGYLVEFDIALHASVCGITFGDTKEGSFGTRVHEAIGAPKNPGGTFTADHDRVTEKPIWGTPIDWMDYSGKVDGKEVGLSVFDHPKNPVRATSHGRAYGLVAANPFGKDKSFPSQKGKTDLTTIKKGDHLKLKYAAYAHTGDVKTGGVETAYKLFAERTTMSKKPFVEHVEMHGHIVDSLLLPKVLDAVLTRGGSYHIEQFQLGERQDDTSSARIEIRADTPAALDAILAEIHPHGAVSADPTDCNAVPADVPGAFPDGFYCSTNFRTQVRVGGRWIDVQDQEMDCGIVIAGDTARCLPMTSVKLGDKIVVGRGGTRVFPPEAETRKGSMFEFMSSPVSSERPKGVSVREIAGAMRKAKAANEKIMAVLGPAVVHTGGAELVVKMIRDGFLNVLFAGNALATHDMEQAFYGTSLGVSLDHGLPTDEGHEHHLRTINTIRRLGGIKGAIDAGKLKSGIMYECVTRGIPTVLCGSIRDDGPIPEVITDVLVAQTEMRKHVPGTGFCLMVATTLHSIAVGNILPASVKVACVDINPATVTKLMDRGSTQTVGIVSDAEPFLRALVAELER